SRRAVVGVVDVARLDKHGGRVLRYDAVRLELADDARQLAAQRDGRLQRAVAVAEEAHVRHADDRRRGALLGLSLPGQLVDVDARLVAPGGAVRYDHVADLRALRGPLRDAPRDTKLDVVRVGGNHENALGGALSEFQFHLRCLSPWRLYVNRRRKRTGGAT